MDIVLTRSAEPTPRTVVRRDDGVTLHLPTHAPSHRLPHDLAHFVIERALGLTRGFWGSIASGVIVGGMEVVSRGHRKSAAERSRRAMKRGSQQFTEAEALVGTIVTIHSDGLQHDWPAARARLDATWRPVRPSRALPTRAEIGRVCDALREAERRWLALAVGESVTLRWTAQ